MLPAPVRTVRGLRRAPSLRDRLRGRSVRGVGARRLLHANPSVGVVVLTMFEDDDSVFAAMRAGARGYLLKGAEQDEILRAVRAAAAIVKARDAGLGGAAPPR